MWVASDFLNDGANIFPLLFELHWWANDAQIISEPGCWKREFMIFFFFFWFVCLFPLCEGFPKMRNTAILPPPPQKRVALYYVKFSMTGWKLISTLNKCADLWFWSNKHKALGDQGKVERKWNKLFLRIQANALPLCQALFLLFFFSHNASDALWLGLCLNWAEAHTQIIFS